MISKSCNVVFALAYIFSSGSTALAQASFEQTVPNFDYVAPGIYRGGTPMQPGGFEFLSDRKIKTIVNLQGGDLVLRITHVERSEGRREEEALAKKFGMRYFNLPIPATSEPIENEKINMGKILSIMTDVDLQPVFIHCNLGNDRTGIMIGLFRVIYQDWPAKMADQEMTQNGHSGIRAIFTAFLSPFLFHMAEENSKRLEGKESSEVAFFEAIRPHAY